MNSLRFIRSVKRYFFNNLVASRDWRFFGLSKTKLIIITADNSIRLPVLSVDLLLAVRISASGRLAVSIL